MIYVNLVDLYLKAVTLVVLITLFTAFSMVSLAATKPVGELIVRPVGASDAVFVRVDGEKATSGRTLFVSSVIITPEQYGATLSLGGLGRLELGTSAKFTLSADGDEVVGFLEAGTVTAYGSGPMAVKTANGSVVRLNAGETADANSGLPAKKSSSGSFPAWGWAVIVGVAIGVTVIALASGGSDNNNTVSPIR